jgi:hypothetical protein
MEEGWSLGGPTVQQGRMQGLGEVEKRRGGSLGRRKLWVKSQVTLITGKMNDRAMNNCDISANQISSHSNRITATLALHQVHNSIDDIAQHLHRQ